MSALDIMATKIIQEQALVIGPLAWSEAGKVEGLFVDTRKGEVTIDASDPKIIIDHLVARYERLFGRASREVCKDAVMTLIKDLPEPEVPSSLRASV